MPKNESSASSAQLSEDRVEKFLNPVPRFQASAKARDQFQKAGALILEAAAEDQNCRDAFEAIQSWIARTRFPIASEQKSTELGVTKDVSDFVAASYLRAQSQLATGNPLSKDDIKKRLPNATQSLDAFGQGFIERLFAEIKLRGRNDPAFGQKLDEATKELKEMSSGFQEQKPERQTRAPASSSCTVNGIPASRDFCIITGIIIGLILIIEYTT